MNSDRLLVYTMAMGAPYDLQPVTPEADTDFICLTDRDDIQPNGWQIQKVTPIIASDPFRSSREFKTCPHRTFGDYECSLFVDSNVELTSPATEMWNYLAPQKDILFGGFYQSQRKSLKQEFRKVRLAKFDYDHVLTEHLSYCRTYFPDILEQQPYWGGILARRHLSANCIKAMEVWFAHVLRFSRRDQLSLPISLSYLDPRQKNIVHDSIQQSPHHRWPAPGSKKPTYRRVK